MRGFKIAVPVVLVALMAATAFAAETKMSKMSSGSTSHNWTLGINGGGSFPTGDFKDAANTGYNIGGQADWWMNSQWGFGADFTYHANNGSDAANAAAVTAYGAGSQAKVSVLQYGAHATYMIPMQGSQVYPYLQGGAGGYDLKTKISGGTTSPSDVTANKFGFNIGAGVDFRATDVVSLGVGGTYNYVPSAIKGATSDKAANWFGLQGRVTFKIPMGK